MALYTGKGDDGTTYVFDSPKGTRLTKGGMIVEALGTVDELNSLLGVVKIKAKDWNYQLEMSKKKYTFAGIIDEVQQNLFIIQAELAGAPKKIQKSKVTTMEKYIAVMTDLLPPISTFFVSGGMELSAHLDWARTVARRAERRVVVVHTEGERKMSKWSLTYLNRLSTLLYALARYSNHLYGASEETPTYS